MLLTLTRSELDQMPELRDQMFRHRREEFHDRLGWDLKIDNLGREMDEYDGLNPAYVILVDESRNHLASGRLLPTTGRTMIGEVFSGVVEPKEYVSDQTWEVTRVFVARRDSSSVRKAAALMWGGCRLGMSAGVHSFISITPRFMARVFATCGWTAKVLQTGQDRQNNEICACRWALNNDILDILKRRTGSLLEDAASSSKISVPWEAPVSVTPNFRLQEASHQSTVSPHWNV